MKIYITLDYEIFFGEKTGTVDKCIIEPIEQLLKIVEPFNIKFVCFVDAGYLIKLEEQKEKYVELQEDYDKIKNQLYFLANNGHGIELHIHPHWEDSFYDGKKWIINTSRYKLSDFNEQEILNIITRYNNILKRISGKNPIAYRAGGWSAQPFTHIKKALKNNDIKIDSSVYPNGYYSSAKQVFNFKNVPQYKTEYNFFEDLTVEEVNGDFKEIPISSLRVSPIFFWKFVLAKVSKRKKHKAFGDGIAITMSKKGIIRLLTRPSYSVVSIDGYKAKLIKKAFSKYLKNTLNNGNFVLIGHPKAFTQFSLYKLEEYIKEVHDKHDFITYK